MKDDEGYDMYCYRCAKVRRIVCTDCLEFCLKCGLDVNEGMEPEEWDKRCKNYRELIKVLSSFVHQTINSARDMRAVPYSSVESMKEDLFKFPVPLLLKDNFLIKEIHDYNLEAPYDGEAAEKALIETAKMFCEESDDE